jgi:tRNA dimethylallyltransferase
MDMDGMQTNALVILGPTASGKTRLGVSLARALHGEIVSADSRQVYRGLDIGSGKDLSEYSEGGPAVPYHLIDIIGLDVEFNVFDYQQRFYETFSEITSREVLPVVVGGTGLYLEAALKGYRMAAVPENPELRAELAPLSFEQLTKRLKSVKEKLHNTTDLEDRERVIRAIEIAEYSQDHAPEPAPDIRPLILGALWDRQELHSRIFERLHTRINEGLIEEVAGLHESGVPWERLERLGLEYRFAAEYLQRKILAKNNLIQKLFTAIRQFAKRQETWFRRMERNGTEIHWVPRADVKAAEQILREHGL